MSEQTTRIEAELAEDRARLRDTVGELGDKLAPKRLVHEASRAIGWGASEVASAVAHQVREKPIPSLLTAVGLAWLVLGGRRSRDDEDGLYRAVDYPTQDELDAQSAWDNYQETSWSLTRAENEDDESFQRRLCQGRANSLGVVRRNDEDDATFKERVERAAEKTKNFAASSRRKIAALARSAAHGVSDAASSAAHAVGGAASAAGHAISGAASSAKHGVENAASAGVHAGGRAVRTAKRRSADFYDEHPLASGAIGFAIGAMAGSALPLSRVEREKLQGIVDEGINRGADSVAGAAKAVGSMAKDVRSSARP